MVNKKVLELFKKKREEIENRIVEVSEDKDCIGPVPTYYVREWLTINQAIKEMEVK